MKNIAVVILNWNGKRLLEKFLPSVVKHASLATIYVADNCSSDDSTDFIKKNFPEVKIICHSCNYGYAGGYNKVLNLLEEKYFVLLNSDVEVSPNWLLPMYELMEKEETIGCCQPKIKDYNRKDYFEYAGAAGGFIHKLGYPFCRGRIFNTIEKDTGQYNYNSEIFWASGACLMVRASIFRKAGGFDEDFFAHMEEIDFCWRVKLLNYKIFYCWESTIFHVGGATLSKYNTHKTYLNFRNNFAMLLKNLPKSELLSKVLFRLLLDGVAGLKFLLEKKPGHTWAIIKAHFYCYGHLKKIKGKRKFTAKKIFSLTGTFHDSILWQYFIKGKKKFSEIPNSASLSS